jgi:ATP-binding cassette subfamily F protein uup
LLENQMALPAGGDYGELEALSHELANLLERIASAEERWLELSDLAG